MSDFRDWWTCRYCGHDQYDKVSIPNQCEMCGQSQGFVSIEQETVEYITNSATP